MSATKRNAAPVVRRDAGLLRREAAGAERRATFRLVTPAVDRHGTIIEPAGVVLDSHKAAGSPFLWMHESGSDFGAAPPPDVVIGKVAEYLQSAEALDIVVEFDDDGPGGLASRCWAKVQAGLLRSVSIGAAVLKSETRNVNGQAIEVFTRTELVEASLVIVGSNREALRIDRAAALRALDALKETPKMDKTELAKTLGIEETADRETAEAACMKYLAGDDATKQAVIKALDEFYPETASGEDKTRADATQTEVEELRAANAMLVKALEEAKAEKGKAETEAKDAAERAAKREAQVVKDVDGWIEEGRVRRSEREKWLTDHRAGKAAGVVRHIPPGTFTAGPRLAETGAPVEMPAAPASETRTIARGLVQQARSLDRAGTPKTGAGATETRSTAKELIADALTLGRGR